VIALDRGRDPYPVGALNVNSTGREQTQSLFGNASLTPPASTPCRSGGARARACEDWPLRASRLGQMALGLIRRLGPAPWRARF
jgi:hypothetical protein